ncbi:MAG: hypothetical protein AMXMBFR25_23010 [Lysobacterales bacterium]|nr:hypothetical protein [Xanthomonadales bacterium]
MIPASDLPVPQEMKPAWWLRAGPETVDADRCFPPDSPLTATDTRRTDRMRGWATALALLCAQATVAAEQTILTVDAEYLETAMPLYTRIATAAAHAAEGTDAQRRADLELARVQRLSDILVALPEEIGRIAAEADADLVVDRAVARRLGETGARDITAQVERALERRFEALPLEGVP